MIQRDTIREIRVHRPSINKKTVINGEEKNVLALSEKRRNLWLSVVPGKGKIML